MISFELWEYIILMFFAFMGATAVAGMLAFMTLGGKIKFYRVDEEDDE